MREKIKLESSAGTGHFYTTSKNKKLMPEKMEIKKFDPVARKHVMYKETKLKSRIRPIANREGEQRLETDASSPRKRGSMLTKEPIDSRFRGNDGQMIPAFGGMTTE